MNMRWILTDSADHCQSCQAASLQIHSYNAWYAAGIYPASPKLYCSEHCQCSLVVTDEAERGNLEDIPVRADTQIGKTELQNTDRIQLQAQATTKGFEIFAITQGTGNGWNFPAAVLKESLALWNNVESFIDHSLQHRSIKDLAGIIKNSMWDEAAQGIKCELIPFGPGADTLIELGKEIVSNKSTKRIGFSADLYFTAQGKTVDKIVRVNSVDLVHEPARGGKFLRALNSQQGDVIMDEKDLTTPDPAEAEKAKALRLQMCSYVLDSGLTASKLPEPMANSVRAQFADKEFTPAELTAAIDAARKLVTDLTGSQTVQGVRLSGMANSDDQIKAAVSDMFGVQRDEGLEKVQPARLSGIRELYHMLTGDFEMHGGYHANRLTLATTTDFTGLVKNALNKLVVNQWQELGRAGYNWWEPIVKVEHFNSLNDITGTLMGTVGSLPDVAEGGEYTELLVGDSPETATWKKRGGYIPLSLELIDRDETRKLASYPRELANAGLRAISALIAAIFTANTNVGPTMADTGALFNATAVTTKGGHANLLTAALAADKWELACIAVYNQPMLIKNDTGLYGTGPKMGVNPKFCLVPRALQLTAKKILYPSLENASNITSENQQQGNPGDVIVVPEWTSTTNWAAVVDPRIAPAIFIGERFGLIPEIFIAGDELSPAVFTNDEHRIKVRQFSAVWVNDFRPLHKTNV